MTVRHAAVDVLLAHTDWPSCKRILQHAAFGAARPLTTGVASSKYGQRSTFAGGGPPLLDIATEHFERTLALAALERVQGRWQEAARLIGWGRNTLTRKLRELGLE